MASVVGSMWLYRKVGNRTLSQVVNQRTVRLSPLPGTSGLTGRAETVVVREPFVRRTGTRRGATGAESTPAAATEPAMPSSAGTRRGAGAAPTGGSDRP
jgi:hypothetical protein